MRFVPMRWRDPLISSLAILFLTCGTARAAEPAAAPDGASRATAFLSKYCFDCHRGEQAEGQPRLDDLTVDVAASKQLAERWRDVMHQLQRSQMPPPDAAQPADAERDAVVDWIEQQLERNQQGQREQNAKVSGRRLNRQEYLHTVRDLFGLHGDFDPTTAFPADEEVDGFRNNRAALRTSGYLIEQYFAAADKVIERAYDEARVAGVPEVQTWTCLPSNYKLGNVSNGAGVTKSDPPTIYMSQGYRSHESDYTGKLFIDSLWKGVPYSGWYDVECDVEARNRQHAYGKELMPDYLRRFYPDPKVYFDPDQPLQISVGQERAGPLGETRRVAPKDLITESLPDNQFISIKFRIWIDRGHAPYLVFTNGPANGTKMQFVTNKLDKYDSTVPKISPEVWANLTARFERNELYNDRYMGPELHFLKITVTGPVSQTEPLAATRLLFEGIDPHARSVDGTLLRSQFRHLASILFRRPVEQAEIEPFATAVETRLETGLDYATAAAPVFKALICSPEFLFLFDASDKPQAISAWQLSSRLSYFLWSSAPDSELSRCAREGSLTQPDILAAQVRRMLADDKSQRLAQHFTEQWLGLNRLGAMAPGMEEFPDYYLFRLEPASKEETKRFFHEVLNQNLPVTSLVNADFTFANEGLGRLYGLSNVPGDELRKVSLPDDTQRFGLLGHSSVLTVTSNGVETSPVMRGVWLLKHLFGTPPSPPPPDVPALEPDIRGATTIRDQLAKHRTLSACNRCHQRIDPLGFALENFDPIGRRRTNYPTGTAIDTSAEYRGAHLNGAADVRNYLLENPRFLARAVAQSMFTYALGRSLTAADHRELNRLVSTWQSNGLGLKDLVILIATSPTFTRE